ncbi:MAG: exosortase T [Rhodospirillales bacterium]
MHRAAAFVRRRSPELSRFLLGLAAGVLAVEPVLWLVETWRDPAYDSNGLLVFAAAAVLFAWSATSARERAPAGRSRALALLALSAAVRLAGQMLAVNTIGALCLVIDVYAVGLLLGLGARARAVSPAWLAVVFAFSLPLERVVQRCIGHALQHVSADGACVALGALYDRVECHGARIVVAGADVLVDLPCSGARTLLLSLLGFAVAAAVVRPGLRLAAAGAAATVAAALAANVLRIVVLAVGLAEPARLGGIEVMAPPWHDAIGVAALALGFLPVVAWARLARRAPIPAPHIEPAAAGPAPRRALPAAAAALAAAVIVVNLPRTPVDVAVRERPVALPLALDGAVGVPAALTARETAFFATYGGVAAKATYGDNGLMLVRTTSPLRHLHAPDECLRGLGFDVRYLGATFAPVPTAAYRAVAPDGARWRIDVSFVSDRGEAATNVAAAVWRWLQGDAGAWTAVQRITPEDTTEADRARWTAAVLAALELPTTRNLAQGDLP